MQGVQSQPLMAIRLVSSAHAVQVVAQILIQSLEQ
jgi:hypothetical protein